MEKTLIYTALLCEAQAVINFLKLKKSNFNNTPLNLSIYTDKNEKYLLVVSGIGKNNCLKALDFVFNNFKIKKAINIGISGCSDSSIKLGTLFCTNKLLPNINFASITTVEEPLNSDENLETLLVDMEAKYFIKTSKKFCDNIFCFKVVSDYLDDSIPKKSFVIELIEKCKDKWKKYL